MNIVLLGAPASGKGTLGAKLTQILNIPHISTGNIIRQNIADKTEIGLRVSKIISKGGLVDDETVNNMVLERLKQDDCKNGFILDGYPRTLAQAETFDSFYNVEFALNIEVELDTCIKRISGRRVCTKCNKTYHISKLESEVCPECGEQLSIRSDDSIEVIKERFELYNQKTKILNDYYDKKNVLKNIDGNGTEDETLTQALEILKVQK